VVRKSIQAILFVSDTERQTQMCVYLTPRQVDGATGFVGEVMGVPGQQVEIAPDARLADVIAELAAAAVTPDERRADDSFQRRFST